ncbi:hypothetical protein M3J09_004820 [Ascochyta lentis]
MACRRAITNHSVLDSSTANHATQCLARRVRKASMQRCRSLSIQAEITCTSYSRTVISSITKELHMFVGAASTPQCATSHRCSCSDEFDLISTSRYKDMVSEKTDCSTQADRNVDCSSFTA